jgi:hypothetical protein
MLIAGIYMYKDYGVSWDEPIQKTLGYDALNYITKKDTRYTTKNKDRYYGTTTELILIFTEKLVNPQTPGDTYELRHLVTFLIFYTGLIFFYLEIKQTLKSKYLALIGTLFLFLSPRIMGHSFYNSKDIPLMSFFIIAMYFINLSISNPKYKNVILAAVTTSLALTTRIVGSMLPVIYICLVGLNLVTKKGEKAKIKPVLLKTTVYLVTLILTTTLIWPILWKNPIQNFKAAFEQMSKYPQKTTTLYFGKKISSLEVPWHYIPGWVLVTTPPIYFLFFILGISNALKNKNLKESTAYILWLLIPLAAVIYLKSTLYNGLRQMFFIYPPIILISLYGIKGMWESQRKILKVVALFLAILSIGISTYKIYKYHPHQYVYFNFLAGDKSNIHKNFELDYWGSAYKQGLEYIEENVDKDKIVIRTENKTGQENIHLANTPERFEYTKHLHKADFYLTTKREMDIGNVKEAYPEFYSIYVDEMKILRVYAINYKVQ